MSVQALKKQLGEAIANESNYAKALEIRDRILELDPECKFSISPQCSNGHDYNKGAVEDYSRFMAKKGFGTPEELKEIVSRLVCYDTMQKQKFREMLAAMKSRDFENALQLRNDLLALEEKTEMSFKVEVIGGNPSSAILRCIEILQTPKEGSVEEFAEIYDQIDNQKISLSIQHRNQDQIISKLFEAMHAKEFEKALRLRNDLVEMNRKNPKFPSEILLRNRHLMPKALNDRFEKMMSTKDEGAVEELAEIHRQIDEVLLLAKQKLDSDEPSPFKKEIAAISEAISERKFEDALRLRDELLEKAGDTGFVFNFDLDYKEVSKTLRERYQKLMTNKGAGSAEELQQIIEETEAEDMKAILKPSVTNLGEGLRFFNQKFALMFQSVDIGQLKDDPESEMVRNLASNANRLATLTRQLLIPEEKIAEIEKAFEEFSQLAAVCSTKLQNPENETIAANILKQFAGIQ